jgi:3-phytase/alkaline phosphatase D
MEVAAMRVLPRGGRRPPLAGRRKLVVTATPIALLALLAAAHGLPPAPPGRTAAQAAATVRQIHVGGVELLGEVRIPPGGTVLGTPLGGLSGITFDAARGLYYAQSDDRSQRAAARFYGLTIDLSDGRLADGDVSFTQVVTLTDQANQTLAPGEVDPEGIALSPSGTVFISSEGNAAADPPVPPWVAEFNLAGRWLTNLATPGHFMPGPGRGVRNNLAFEPLTVSPGGTRLVTATEAALAQDGPVAAVDAGSPARLLFWDLPRRAALAEHVYPVAPWPLPPDPPTAPADNGLVELVALDEGETFLALERSYATAVGNTVRLFEATVAGATDVAAIPALLDPTTGDPVAYQPMSKRLVADIGELGLRPDNIEGMTFGPTLPDGRRVLVLVSDDNFNPLQVTQLVALAVELTEAETGSECYLPVGYPGR